MKNIFCAVVTHLIGNPEIHKGVCLDFRQYLRTGSSNNIWIWYDFSLWVHIKIQMELSLIPFDLFEKTSKLTPPYEEQGPKQFWRRVLSEVQHRQ